MRQNVNVHYKDPKSTSPPAPCESSKETGTSGTGKVAAGWKNHFSAFGSQDVKKILLDNSEKSIITVYNQVTGVTKRFTGLEGVEACFTIMFRNLFDLSDLAAPIQVVEEASADGKIAGNVYLVWSAAKSGYTYVTDTFIFDAGGKIFRQNVVVHYTKP